MANKSSGGKSGGGQSMQWNPSSGHQLAPPTMNFSKGGWAPAPTGTMSSMGATQTFGAQPGQLPAMGQPAAKPTNPVMAQLPSAQQQPVQQTASPDMQQRFQGLNPFVKWFFAQQAQRRGLGGPAMAYQNFYNRHHQ